MLSFLEFLKNYIKSCSEKLSVVAVKYNSCENSFSYLLSEFLDFIENKKTKEDFWVFIEGELNFLKEEEKLQIFDIFTTMGEFDEYGELNKLEFKKKIIEEKFKKIVGENNKFSPFFIKISIVVACFLFIVFI